MAEVVFFYTFTALMLAAAVSVALNRHPIYSVLSLLVVMFCLASLFIMLGAYFLAAIQVLLYAGAVLVLFLFAIMLLNLSPEALSRTKPLTMRGVGAVLAVFLFLHLARAAVSVRPPMDATPAQTGSVEAVGRLLFTKYLLPFELISFLILAALIGAVILSKQNTSSRS